MRKSMIKHAEQLLKSGLATAEKLGADAAKLGFAQTERIGCTFENARLKQTDSAQTIALSVEVLTGGRRANASGNDLGKIDELVERAMMLAKIGSAAHFDAYPAPPASLADVKTHSPRTAALRRDQMIDACDRIADALKGYNPDLFIEADASRNEMEKVLVTTGGVSHTELRTHWNLGAYAQQTEGTDMLFAGYWRSGLDLDEQWTPRIIIDRTLEDLRFGQKLADPPTGKVTAILPPEIFSQLLGALELGVNGRNVAKGDSPLRGRCGEKILDEHLTIIDDPHADFCLGAKVMDSCGVPTRQVPIVERGVLKNFLYDLDSAGLAGTEPTGNNGCAANSLKVFPGVTPSEQLLGGIDDGILIKQLLGFGQSNLINGDFSCNVGLGFRIKDGKIVGRVKDTMVAGNFYELLADNVRLSSDVDPVHRTPWAVIEDINVSAAQSG